jgi:DNA-binding HxlR family transcriptional regulator
MQGERIAARMLKSIVQSDGGQRNASLFRKVLDQVGDKWSVLIVAVLEDGPRHFNEIKRQVGAISHRVLTRKLRDLAREGYVSRTVHPVRPPRVEYQLTPLGRSLVAQFTHLLEWTLQAVPQIERALETFDVSARSNPSSPRHALSSRGMTLRAAKMFFAERPPIGGRSRRGSVGPCRAFTRVWETQCFESRDQSGWLDAEELSGAVRSVDASLRKLQRRANVLLLATSPFDLRYHGPRRFAPRRG